jgi:hypothetical protein
MHIINRMTLLQRLHLETMVSKCTTFSSFIKLWTNFLATCRYASFYETGIQGRTIHSGKGTFQVRCHQYGHSSFQPYLVDSIS